MADQAEVLFFENLRRGDVALVGGNNSSLGEMVQELGNLGVDVPPGFATTADAFRRYMAHNNLNGFVDRQIERLDQGNVNAIQGKYSISATKI